MFATTVVRVAGLDNLLYVSPATPLRTVKDVIDGAKAMALTLLDLWLDEGYRDDVAAGRADPEGDAVRLRGVGQVDDRVRQVELGLREPDVLHGLGGGGGQRERQRVGHPDVLGGEDHEATRDEPRVLAGLEHPGQPVEPGVGVGAADRLDERGDDVVVLVLAVPDRARRERGLRERQRDLVGAGLHRERGRDLERGEEVPTVALGPVDEVLERVLGDREVVVAEASLGVGERAPHERSRKP